ncbi:UDP-glucose/GDP-mannose dehydrogenase family protein [Candidatus Woesearchaeota archaeon]|nr:UDP-glucose/GDP-mannose dehydrogenase family protein [Candidatus Woesearchaeota archaeon]
MRLAIIGTGYVGLVTGTCLATLGNHVACIDIDREKIARLEKGIMPIYEPGLKEMVGKNVRESRLSFTTSLAEGIAEADVVFIAVGTPSGKDGKADLTAVEKVAEALGRSLDSYKVIVTKSTVPVGTTERVKGIIEKCQKKKAHFDVASNPEFLREGKAIKDFLNPDRVVVGVSSPKAKEVMERLYRPLQRVNRPIIFTDIRSSELIKYASNAFLAAKISFINQISRLAEKVGADIKQVATGMGLDNRIGPRFLQAGLGYGGSCFPKDVRALVHMLKENSCSSSIMEAVEQVNREQQQILVHKAKAALGSLKGKSIAIWGLSFKPDTDDMREAPSAAIIGALLKEGASVSVFDPVAMEEAKKIFPSITYGDDPYAILKDAHALILITEWDEFKEPDFKRVRSLLKAPFIIDGRNIYDPQEVSSFGLTYIGMGR